MQSTAVEINLIPPQATQFRGAESVAVSNKDHGGVSVPVTGTLAGDLLEPFNLFFG
jgi:hypothetical protein